MNNNCILVVVEFDCDILHFDVPQWNEFMEKLVRRGMTPVAWSKGKKPPPIGVMFNFRNLQRTCARLQGIDLTFCDLEGANFTGSNLQGAKFGSCPKASFKHAWLELACFQGDISGCSFTADGSDLEDADFRHAYYFANDPPTGLPVEKLADCEVVLDEPEQPPVIEEKILRAKATITNVPW